MAFSAQAQSTQGICGRTQEVQDAILTELQLAGFGRLSCERVTDNHLSRGSNCNNRPLTVSITGKTELTSLKPGDFAGMNCLLTVWLRQNQLDILPNGIFLGLTRLVSLNLEGNPGETFQFPVEFEPATLEEDFTAESVRLVLRVGAPRTITVPLLINGGTLLPGSPNPLTIATGSTQSASVTVIRGSGKYFRLAQGELELGGKDSSYTGHEIVQGSAITFGGVLIKARIFLEGALE